MDYTLKVGLAPDHRAGAAQLYWQAFGGKLGRVLGPAPLALAYLDRVIREDHVITAVSGGELIGLAGFKSPRGGFAEGSWTDLRAIYGTWGAIWRQSLLGALITDVDNSRFLVDGICVAAAHRGRGIGAALLRALMAEGCARGYGAIRLEVTDDNSRARRLYERLGFRATDHARLGLLRHAYGFDGVTTMIRDLARGS